MSVHSEIENPVGNAAAHEMTLDEAIAHAEDVADRCDTSCGREHRQLADWLKELRDIKSRNVGNAAAMREVLVRVLRLANVTADGEGENWDWNNSIAENVVKVVKEALAAPARNCDIYPKRDDAGEAWNKTLDERTRDMVQRYPLTAMDMFIDWLLAYAEPDACGDLCHED